MAFRKINVFVWSAAKNDITTLLLMHTVSNKVCLLDLGSGDAVILPELNADWQKNFIHEFL